MYLIVIAWLYVTVTMSIAEASSSQGTVLGAIVTFFMYGFIPMGILIYIFGTPERKRRLKAQRESEQRAWEAAQDETSNADASSLPDTSGHAPGGAQNSSIAPVREKQ